MYAVVSLKADESEIWVLTSLDIDDAIRRMAWRSQILADSETAVRSCPQFNGSCTKTIYWIRKEL
jgi:hypothetical protein